MRPEPNLGCSTIETGWKLLEYTKEACKETEQKPAWNGVADSLNKEFQIYICFAKYLIDKSLTLYTYVWEQ